MPESGYIAPEPSWDLKIFVPDQQVERILRVRGDMHIGGVMLKLHEELEAIDWSDHSFWWPKKNCWLLQTRTTLNHYGVQADSHLIFTTMHKLLRVQLPDLRCIDAKVDFSTNCFTAVRELCKELGIRYGEELSFFRPLTQDHLRINHQMIGVTSLQRPQSINTTTINSTYSSQNKNGTYKSGQYNTLSHLDTRSHSPDITSTLSKHASYRGFTTSYNSKMLAEDLKNLEISNSPNSPSSDAKSFLLYPSTLLEKARMNAGWLDTSSSLYEQNVRDFDTLLLRFKFLEFYDLNPKLDMARINQIYEQAKWSLATEEVTCSEDDISMFNSLQQQIQQRVGNPIPEDLGSANDDIDTALNELQAQLEGSTTGYDRTSFNHQAYNQSKPDQNFTNSYNTATNYALETHNIDRNDSPSTNMLNDITNFEALELCDYIKFIKVRKFTFKSFKRLYFVLRDTILTAYRNKEYKHREEPAFSMDLRGIEVISDVNVHQGKIQLRLLTSDHNGNAEYCFRFDTEEQYCRWMAAIKLAVQGKSITDPSYDKELRATSDLYALQSSDAYHLMSSTNNNNDVRIDDYLTTSATNTKYSRGRSRGSHSAATRILETHSNGKYGSSATDLKLVYINAWRALPEYGVHMFVVRFPNSNRDEILGIMCDRLIRIDPNNGNHINVWNFNSMKEWKVNWEVKQMVLKLNEGDVAFFCVGASCKTLHEFIGGYQVLSLRSKDSNQTLNEDFYHKQTGGWD